MFLAHADKLDRPAASLSGGEAQMLALARGLEAEPRLLLLDEPSLGLSPKLAEEVFGLIRRLRDQGLTMLLVEQNVRQTLALADRAYVLESGRITLQGTASELLSDDRLVSNYLGVSAGPSFHRSGRAGELRRGGPPGAVRQASHPGRAGGVRHGLRSNRALPPGVVESLELLPSDAMPMDALAYGGIGAGALRPGCR